MGSVISRIDRIGSMTFTGKKTPAKVAAYAKANQELAHDLARELEEAASAAEAAMLELKGHPLLLGLDVQVRAWRAAAPLRKARELAHGISAEAVKFNAQFRQEFIDGDDVRRATGKGTYRGRVTL